MSPEPPSQQMHAGEVEISVDQVRRLLRSQLPQWAALPLSRVPSSGTDNALFRLGEGMVVRLPRIEWAVESIDRERRWLPRLGPALPLRVPLPVAAGEPDAGYPWPWAIYEWLDGADALSASVDDLSLAAADIARFTNALHGVDTTDGPATAVRGRGAPLHTVDAQTRRSIAAAAGLVDTGAVTAAWLAALDAPEWDAPPVWFHGDIASGNLLVRQGRIFAVVDFGALGIGDPAIDLAVAWELLDRGARRVLRIETGADDATWARARGWALCTAIWALPYYLHTNPPMVAQARRKIAAVLDDARDRG